MRQQIQRIKPKGFHPLERLVLQFIKKHLLLEPHEKIIVCVSGGPDSIALLNILYNLQDVLNIEELFVAHFNHNLRPESSKEKVFVKDVARRLGLSFFSAEANIAKLSRDEKLSIETCARKYRYNFFFDLKKSVGANKITTAHNANDRAEELLLRLIRGVGPSGFSSLPVKTRTGIVRPLLCAYRGQILSYLEDKGIAYMVDSTNVLPLYQRNRIRLEVLPLLSKISGRKIEILLNRTADLCCDEDSFWEILLDEHWQRLSCPEYRNISGNKLVVWSRDQFKDLHKALQRRLIRKAIEYLEGNAYGLFLDHVEFMRRVATEAISGRHVRWHDVVFEVEGKFLIFRKDTKKGSDDRSDIEFRINSPGSYKFEEAGLKIMVKFVPPDFVSFSSEKNEAFMDADSVKWPLFFRFWRRGDRFCPLGMRGRSKKLQDFFTDRKIPKSQRSKTPIVADREKICWVVGLMLDERVRVTRETKRVIYVAVEKFSGENL